MKSFWIMLGMITVLSGVRTGAVAAGECTDSNEEYVRLLEAGPRAEGFDYAQYCVSYDFEDRGHRWAGPVAARAFAAVRSDTLRPRIQRAVARLFRSAWADSGENRRTLLAIAARSGIARIDSVDVFDALFKEGLPPEPMGYQAYQELAILQDCRAVDLLAEQYSVLRRAQFAGASEPMSDLLSCLYHIPCPQSVALAKRLLASESDPALKVRLRKVIDRP